MWTVKVYVKRECIESHTYKSTEEAIAKKEELKQKYQNVVLLKETVWKTGIQTVDAFVSFAVATVEVILGSIFR